MVIKLDNENAGFIDIMECEKCHIGAKVHLCEKHGNAVINEWLREKQ